MSSFNASNLSKEEGDDAEEIDDDGYAPLSRCYSLPAAAGKLHEEFLKVRRSKLNNVDLPKEHPMRRVRSIEDISEMDEDEGIMDTLTRELSTLKDEIFTYKTINDELHESLDFANSLLHEEMILNRRLSQERSSYVNETEVSLGTITENRHASIGRPRSNSGRKQSETNPRKSSLERQNSGDRKPPLERKNSIVHEEDIPQQTLYGRRKMSLTMVDMIDLMDSATEADKRLTAKSLPFQV